MYKRASQNMQHANRVDRIDPARGMTDGAGDTLPDPATMEYDEAILESQQLAGILASQSNMLTVAKQRLDDIAVRAIGAMMQQTSLRRSAVRLRLRQLDAARVTPPDLAEAMRRADNLAQAIREVADDATGKAIFIRARALNKETKL